MAILGVILVLGGVAAFWAGAVTSSHTAGAGDGTAGSLGRLDRSLAVAGRLPADRLITWGVVLLGLSAVAAGAITFSATAAAGTS